jgi:ribonuclease-3
VISASVSLHDVQDQLALRFDDESLLQLALTHPSYANEHPDAPGTNERLEFLGDAVLGLVIAERLYQRFPDVEEGQLTQWRAHLVQGSTLARAAARLGLGRWLLLGRGEDATGGREREGNLAHVYEALVGAITLDRGADGGQEGARRFIERSLASELEALATDPAELNPKGALQQLAESTFGRPHYVTTDESGPEHEREFAVEVQIGDEVFGRGHGSSKQQAEKAAAREAVQRLRERLDGAASANGESAGTSGGVEQPG